MATTLKEAIASGALFSRTSLLGAVAHKLARDIETGAVKPGSGSYTRFSGGFKVDESGRVYAGPPCCTIGHLRSRAFGDWLKGNELNRIHAAILRSDGVTGIGAVQWANDRGNWPEVCRILRAIP